MELVVNLGEERMRIFADDADWVGEDFDDAIVCGAHSGYFVIDTSRPSPVIGVHFRPGGAAPFLGLPARELRDRDVALEHLWGQCACELHDRLMQTSSPPKMFRLLEDVLLRRLDPSHLPHPIAIYALAELSMDESIARIRQVQEATGYRPKRFIDLFSDSVGLTPKVFSRIRRFQRVIHRVARGRHVEWARVAADSGYCDQSHLNREFRRFSGTTPPLYHPVAEDRPSHVAI
jgi:AraC-like DNA-binding protein